MHARTHSAIVLSCIVVAATALAGVAAAAEGTPSSGGVEGDQTAGPAMNASGAWEQGYTGENVTVAVTDDVFDADHPTIADNVVGTYAPGGEGEFDEAKAHGTNVSATVLQTAPDADLLLYDPGATGEPLADALRRAGERADVVVTAYGEHFDRPLDGTSAVSEAINDVEENGTTVVASAGNYGNDHFVHDTWRDADGDGWHEFPDGEERARVTGGLVWDVQWSDWEDIDSDYDFYIVDESGEELYNATADQRTEDAPTPWISPDYDADQPAYLRIRGTNPDPDDRITIDLWPRQAVDAEFGSRARSLVSFAAAEGAITVGAYDVHTDAIAPYSSRGPTVDGRQKPEVVGAANVSAPPGGYFEGTSAAAPAVAGVTALMEEADPDISPELTEAILTETAQPVSGDEPNNVTGHGLVDAGTAVELAAEPTVEPVDGATPTDPDGDGLYEDVDGNGAVTRADAEVLFGHMYDANVTDHADAYDFDGDGQVSHGDVVELHQIASAAAPPAIDGTSPRDIDGDGLYEDLNADGELTRADAEVFFEHMHRPAVADHVDAYDFNDDDRIGHGDVVELYQDAG